MLDRDRRRRDHVAGVAVPGAAAPDEHRAAVDPLRRPPETAPAGRAPHEHRVAAAVEHRGHPLVAIEPLDHAGRQPRGPRTARRGPRRRRATRFGQQGVVHPQHEVAFEHPDLAGGLGQDDRAPEGAAVPVEILRRPNLHPHHVGGHRAVRAARPCPRVADDRHDLRFDHLGMEPLQRPPAPEREPFLADVGEAPPAQPLHRPLPCGFDGRRSGQARSVHVAEPAGQLHDLRALQPFLPDRRHHPFVERLRRGKRRRCGQHARQEACERSGLHRGLTARRRRRRARRRAGARRCRPRG